MSVTALRGILRGGPLDGTITREGLVLADEYWSGDVIGRRVSLHYRRSCCVIDLTSEKLVRFDFVGYEDVAFAAGIREGS